MSFEPQEVSTKERLKDLFHEGMVRHVIVRKESRSIVDLPLNVIILATLLAPWLTGIGALIALLTRHHIGMVRREDGTAEPFATPLPPSEATATPGGSVASGMRQQPEVPGEQTFPDEMPPPPTD